MIIYGRRDVSLQSTTFDEQFCTNCGMKGAVTCTVFSRYAHIFWIPLFPYSKKLLIRCSSCGKVFNLNELNPSLQPEIKEFYRKCKAPFWQWVGLTLIIASVLLNINRTINEKNDTKQFFNSPEINDVYCFKYEDGYTLMLIDDISNDSVYFLNNEYYFSNIIDVKKLHRLKYYNLDETYGYSREELDNLFNEEKIIIKIWRALPYSTEDIEISEEINDIYEEFDDEDDDEYVEDDDFDIEDDDDSSDTEEPDM